ncbi:MAG: S9 family peptidase, partial [Acidobacteria bacterium]|nr:S9 family peptidase [Acidobacteriota bacterium]
MKRNMVAAFFVLLLSLLVQSVHGQRAMTPADTLRVAGVSDAQISPDGEWVVYTVSVAESNTTRTTLWLARVSRPSVIQDRGRTSPDAPGKTEPLLPAGLNGSNPRWSPDGKRIAFLASKDKQNGIWIVTLAQRQPRFVAPIRATNFHIPYAGESFAWSPDSRRIAFISAIEDIVAGESRSTLSPTPSRDDAKPDDPRIVDRIQYKSRTSFSDRARTHVWIVDADSSSPDNDAAIRQLTSGAFYDHALTWSPRGDEVAFLSNHELDPEANNNSDIFAVDMQGRVRQLTETKGCEYEPAWSPDGKWIAYTATKRDVTTIDSVAEDAHVWVIEANGGTGRELTAAQDRRARSPRWSADSRAVLYLAGDKGQTLLYRIGLSSGKPQLYSLFKFRVVDGKGSATTDNFGLINSFELSGFSGSSRIQIANFSIAYRMNLPVRSPNGELGFRSPLSLTIGDPTHPTEVWVQESVQPFLHRISSHNDALIRSLARVEHEEVNFKSFDGTNIQGWLMKPIGWREGRRYPLILSIHGGPHGMYGYGFNATFQAYAARGYAVLYLNPRGSSGYGQKFSDGTLREWGGGDYRDLMLGVDEIVRTRSWIDSDRMGVTGGS